MAHNMLITQPGQREAVVALGAAMEDKGYVPETDKVLAAIPVLKPGEQQSMLFKPLIRKVFSPIMYLSRAWTGDVGCPLCNK